MYNVKKLYTFPAVFLSVNCNKELLRMDDYYEKNHRLVIREI